MADLFMERGAEISACGRYRYRLSRHWRLGYIPEATFIMLNPSTADAEVDDPTIRKCVGFAQRWGMAGLYVGNLFAVRATDPSTMLAASDPVGPDNRDHLEWMIERAGKNGGMVVCAWGTHGAYMDQDETVLGWLDDLGVTPMALRLNRDGTPQHPLYIPYEAQPTPYAGRVRRKVPA